LRAELVCHSVPRHSSRCTAAKLVIAMSDRYAAAMPLLPARVCRVPSAGAWRPARISILSLAALSSFALTCVRDRDQAPPPSAKADVEPVAAVPATPAVPTSTSADPTGAPATPQPKAAEPGTSTACTTDDDCRTFSDACPNCSCRPFAKKSPDPKCPGPRSTCLIDPCTGLRTICRNGNCMIGDPGDSAPPSSRSAVLKDGSSSDATGKRSNPAPSGATSATPKTPDGAVRD
jgi:hypothetical protein